MILLLNCDNVPLLVHLPLVVIKSWLIKSDPAKTHSTP